MSGRHHHSNSNGRSSGSIDPTKNFRPNYLPRVTEPQREQFRRDQTAYEGVPSGIYEEGRRIAERMDGRNQEWKERHRVRQDTYDRTETARMERRGRDDPDIQARK